MSRHLRAIRLLATAALLPLAATALPAWAQNAPASTSNQSTGQDAASATPAAPAAAAPAAQPASPPANAAPAMPDMSGQWYTFNGDLAAQKYAAVDQITPQNAGQLTKAWEYHTGDVSDGSGDKPSTVWSATPLFVNDTVYISTPFYRAIALEPDTGKVKWTYDSKSTLKGLTQGELKTRGVAYWQSAAPQAGQPCQKIIYLGTMDAHIHALDADTGKLCTGFAQGGVLDVNQWNPDQDEWPLSILQPPTIYNNLMFIGWAGKDWADSKAPPGEVFAVDTQTGELKWTFATLPKDIWNVSGTANVWASMSIDRERGILDLPISTASPDFWGGDRKQKLPLANSVAAVDANTGKLIWSYQFVHHDIWDYDINSAPTLVDIQKDGQTVPALVQTSKMGFIFVLNRVTGEPIYPIEEKPVPASDVDGEQASATQPFESVPEPVVPDQWPGVFNIADWASLGYCSRTAAGLRNEGRYTPPSLKGTLTYPPTSGGIEWGGGAVDPNSGIYYVNSSRIVQIYQLVPRAQYDQLKDKTDYYEQKGAPYAFHLTNFLNPEGMPCWNPPYGLLSAYDLKTGKMLWREPFGQTQKWGFYMPEDWGSPTIGAPVVTKGGVLFIGGSMDARVRAIDEQTGKVLWKDKVMAPAVAIPTVYTYKGREYVVFVAGGNSILKPEVGDQIVAYALPAK
jgi:quinoprotein glucose dehydrogenase